MYVINRRYLDHLLISGSGQNIGSSLNNYYQVPRLVEGVYSWRTGRRAISDPPESPPTRHRDGYGIFTPSGKGNLVQRLADRKRYIEDFQRAAFPAETQTGSVSTDRVSKTDSGHLFVNNKTLRYPFVVKAHWYNKPSPSNEWYDGLVAAGVGSQVVNPSPFPLGFLQESSTNSLGVTATDRQGMANRYFAATAPDRNDATLGVTLIELLRGDIPSVLKNFQEMMAGYRSVKNFVGSDTLNIMFGWTPLIQEYANLIKVGMTLERAIYYESFRRKRQWDGPSQGSSQDTVFSLSAPLMVYGSQTYPQQGTSGQVTGSGRVLASISAVKRTVIREDYHWSSRYTGLAKASRRANDFSDRALDVVQRLGLVDDPTLLWDLTPYSWLVDWFTTMGDSLTNAATYSPIRGKYSVDYAYLTTRYTTSSQADAIRLSTGLPKCDVVLSEGHSMYSSVTTWRDRATPFGFGTQMGSLSGSQFAILVALGLAQFR